MMPRRVERNDRTVHLYFEGFVEIIAVRFRIFSDLEMDGQTFEQEFDLFSLDAL